MESSSKTAEKDMVQKISFPDDDYASMETIMNILHHQGHKVPVSVSTHDLYMCAKSCDKYDLSGSLGPWAERWSQEYIEKIENTTDER